MSKLIANCVCVSVCMCACAEHGCAQVFMSSAKSEHQLQLEDSSGLTA